MDKTLPHHPVPGDTLAAWCIQIDGQIRGFQVQVHQINTAIGDLILLHDSAATALADQVCAEIIRGERDRLMKVEEQALGGDFAENALISAAIRLHYAKAWHGVISETQRGDGVLAAIEQVCQP